MARIFISYQRRTDWEIVRRVRDRLNAAFPRDVLRDIDAVPDGLCQIVTVWEMSASDEEALLLTLVARTVSIGNPGGPLCPSAVSDVEDRRPLSTVSGKKFYEPQPRCDYISPTIQ